LILVDVCRLLVTRFLISDFCHMPFLCESL
jgi:hypothetical protein